MKKYIKPNTNLHQIDMILMQGGSPTMDKLDGDTSSGFEQLGKEQTEGGLWED